MPHIQDLGNLKGCAYAKFFYDPYKTDWVYTRATRLFLYATRWPKIFYFAV